MKKIIAISVLSALLLIFVSGCANENNRNEFDRYTLSSPKGVLTTVRKDAIADEPKLPELNSDSQLSDYLAHAALNNPGLEAAFNQWKAALAQTLQVSSLPDPKFNYRYFIEEVETRTGPQRQSFEISQKFPWFGKLALAGDIAMQKANAAKARYESVKLKLFFEVKDAYYEYYYLARAIAITKENIDLMVHLESVVQSRFKTNVGTHPDVIRAQVEIGKLEDTLNALQDLRNPYTARLNAAMDRTIDAAIPWPERIELQDVTVDDRQLLATLIASNPQLKALDFETSSNLQNVELAKKVYYPDVTFGVGVIDTRDRSSANPPSDSGKDPVIAMVSINLPLWSEKNDAVVHQAKARYRAAKKNQKQITNSLSWRLKKVIYDFRDAERKMDLYKNALLPKATESLKVTESGFRAGKSTFTDLVDVQRIYLEFALAHQRALTDRQQSLANLEMLVGQEIRRK